MPPIGSAGMSPGRRAALLAACLLAGIAIGAGGTFLTGNPWWFTAVPAVLAAGWLVVADPQRCQPGRGHGSP
jgi:hypothetical protein